MIVKICGLRTKRDLISAIKAGADEIGFVVGVPESKRTISYNKARELLKIRTSKKTVAVTVAKRASEMEKIIREIQPHAIQIHGRMPAEEWRKMRAFCKRKRVEVIRAIKAGASAEKDIAGSGIGTILLDSATIGGTGKKADWKRCARIVKKFPGKKIRLSGGLTPGNVQEAVRIVKPWAVDVSSGVEKKGKKSFRKMSAFVKAAHAPS